MLSVNILKQDERCSNVKQDKEGEHYSNISFNLHPSCMEKVISIAKNLRQKRKKLTAVTLSSQSLFAFDKVLFILFISSSASFIE